MKMINAFSLDTSPLSADACALAEREIRETPEQVQKSLAELRELLKGKPKTTSVVPEAIKGLGNNDRFAVISTLAIDIISIKIPNTQQFFRFQVKSVLILQRPVFLALFSGLKILFPVEIMLSKTLKEISDKKFGSS